MVGLYALARLKRHSIVPAGIGEPKNMRCAIRRGSTPVGSNGHALQSNDRGRPSRLSMMIWMMRVH